MSFTYSVTRDTTRTHFTIKDITGKSFLHFLCSVSFEIPNLPIMLNVAVGLISQIRIVKEIKTPDQARRDIKVKKSYLTFQDLLPLGTPRLMPEKRLLPTEWAFLYLFYSARRIRCSIQGYNFHKSRVITSCCPSRKAISYADLFLGKTGPDIWLNMNEMYFDLLRGPHFSSMVLLLDIDMAVYTHAIDPNLEA